MSEKQISDFIVSLGDYDPADLESYRIFRIEDLPIVKNQMYICNDLKAVDVPVRQSGGRYVFNQMFGRPNVIGQIDLEKQRKTSFETGLLIPLKSGGKPNVYIMLPPTFELLADAIKNHPDFAPAFELGYMSRQNKMALKQMMIESGISRGEMEDRISQSNTSYMENIRKAINSFQQDSANLQREVQSKKPEQQDSGMGQY
jgi:hypothetical protein